MLVNRSVWARIPLPRVPAPPQYSLLRLQVLTYQVRSLLDRYSHFLAKGSRTTSLRAPGLRWLALEAVHRSSPDVCRWYVVNAAIDIYVNGGCYERALAAADR